MRFLSAAVVLLAVGSAAAEPAHAQSAGSGEPGARRLIPRAEEIALARSAATADVSDSAAIWVFTERGYELAVPGTAGVACLVSRDWLQSLEPICYDAEGTETIMKIGMRRIEMLHQGVPVAEADARTAAAITTGELRLPTRPALAYMLSSAQRLISDDGRPVGAWAPHLMLYYPYMSAAALGIGPAGVGGTTFVSDGGTPLSVLIVKLQDFVDPRPVATR
jgi:hypothetical protein